MASMVWKLMGFGDRDRAKDARAREARDCLRERRRSSHLAHALRLEDSDLVHKVFCAMVLSEAVYKQNDEEVIRFVQLTNGMLPWTLPANKLTELQFSSDWASQRCLVTESGGCLFVCFRGTKVNRDFITDLNVFFDPVFESYSNGESRETSAAGKPKPSKADTPCAHRGFLFRAKQVPILWFYKIAKTKGLKLIFTGHSLGGAVAALATIRLLHWLDLHGKKWDASNVSCISFAAPAMGNLALQKYATSQDWDNLIYNYTLQEDFVPILMQPQRLFRWTSKKSLLPSAKAVAAPPPPDLEGGEAGKGGSGAAGQNGGPPTAPGEDRPVSKLPAPPEGDTSKDLKRTGSGDVRYIRQVVKFAVRLRRMVPIAGRGSGDSARVGNTFAYVGKQLTVLDSAIVPASLKNEVLREYKELSKEVPEGAEREQPGDAETSRRWNLVRWAVQSFESHRMYSYRDRILAACRLVPNVPDPLPVALTDTVLPRVELNFGTVRLCKPLDSSRRTNSASAHITLAGRNLLPCRNFQMEALGRRIKVDKFFSSKLDRIRATTWTKMRLPESLSFWSKAFGDSEEVYQLLVRVQLNASLRWEDMVAAPLRAVCRSDFEETSLGLVVVPVHVRLSGRHFGHAHILRGLLTLYEDREATEAEAGALDLMNERWAGSPGPSRRNSLDREDPEAFPREERFQRIVNYSVLNTFDVLRNWVKRPLVTIEETSDTILFVDTVDRWETEGRVPAIPYQVKRAHDHGVESFLVLLRPRAPLLSFSFGSSTEAGAAEVDPEARAAAIEQRVAEAGFTKVVFLNRESSEAIIGASHDWLSPHALYATLARRGYRDVVKTLSKDPDLMDQVKHIHDALHFNLSTSQLPSPLLHKKTMGRV